jgi:hypothetical protein
LIARWLQRPTIDWPTKTILHFDTEMRMELSLRFKYSTPMTDALKKLLEAAKTANPTPEHREQQRRSFVYGNTHFENELITRDMVDREADRLAEEDK